MCIRDSIVKLLIGAGANPNAASPDGSTALMYAAAECHTRTVEVLLVSNADVTAFNNAGNTALDFWRAACATYPAIEIAWQEQTGSLVFPLEKLPTV